MNTRKGQVSHVFMTIFTLIVFATIFIFGYKAITGIIKQGDDAAFVQFKTDIEKSIRSVAHDVDSVVVHNSRNPLRVPGKYKKVCFVDVDHPFTGCPAELDLIACDTWKTASEQGDPAIAFDAWERADANVFASPAGPFPMKTTPVRFENNRGYLCIATPGRLDMRLTGKGSYTLVSALGG
jgi:hypothetical protein